MRNTAKATMAGHCQDVTLELVFDFDGTITTEDTISSLAKVAMDFQVDRGRSRNEMEMAWTAIVQSYIQDLDRHQDTYVPPVCKPPKTPWDIVLDQTCPIRPLQNSTEINLDRFSGRQRRHIELASLARVKDEGLFKGIWPKYFFIAGQHDRLHHRVRVREGFDPFTAQARQEALNMHALSVNWSTPYIEGVLGSCGMTSVIANSTNEEDGSISARGTFESPQDTAPYPEALTVAQDKVVALRRLYWRRKSLQPDKGLHFIYFGDSSTDLECLMEVGGVIISNDEHSGLLNMLRQELDYHVPHVSEWKEDGFTCWARDFSELLQHNYLARKVSATKNTDLTKTFC